VMLGLRSLAVALLATSYAGFASAQAIVNGKQSNYPDGYYGDSTHPGPQTMCLLSGFSFSPAMTITPAFDMGQNGHAALRARPRGACASLVAHATLYAVRSHCSSCL